MKPDLVFTFEVRGDIGPRRAIKVKVFAQTVTVAERKAKKLAYDTGIASEDIHSLVLFEVAEV